MLTYCVLDAFTGEQARALNLLLQQLCLPQRSIQGLHKMAYMSQPLLRVYHVVET